MHISPAPKEKHLINVKYRADIDGLRALAVLSVVGFHAFPHWVKGGFIGVDIFFVISGFLISSIIIASIEDGSFSFKEFYARRIKRIFPALIMVMIACYAFGWASLLPDEYLQLSKHIAAGVGFVSNLFSAREIGYFDTAAATKPLLHLWSLGIEEQFYIVWPLLLYVAWTRRINSLLLIISIAFFSFVVNVGNFHFQHFPRIVFHPFYSPISRFWELLIGSALAYITLHDISILNIARPRVDAICTRFSSASRMRQTGVTLLDIQSALGIMLIGSASLFVSREVYSGWWALLPTFGTYLIISAGPQAWFNRVVLSRRVMVWFGLISYPLYLWHWPLLSYAHIMEGSPGRDIRIALVLLSIVLAWLTYKLIEKPIRLGSHSGGKAIVMCTLLLTIGCVGFYSFRHNVINSGPTLFMQQPELKFSSMTEERTPGRITDIQNRNKEIGHLTLHSGNNRAIFNGQSLVNYVPNIYAFRWSPEMNSTEECNKIVGFSGGYCVIQNPNSEPTMALVGDSHANAIFEAVEAAASRSGKNLIQLGGAGCPPFIGVERDNSGYCPSLMNEIVSFLTKNPNIKTVVLSGRFAATISGINFGEETPPGFYSLKEVRQPNLSDRSTIFEDGLESMIVALHQANKQVIILFDLPELDFDPTLCLPWRAGKECVIKRNIVEARQAEYREVIRLLVKKHPTLITFDLMPYFCKDDKCYAKSDGFILYRDSHHLGINGNAYLVHHEFDKALARLMTSTP